MAFVHSPVTNVTLEHHWGSQETNMFTSFKWGSPHSNMNLIQMVLACVPTSAATERLFSVAGALKTAERSRLSPKNLWNKMMIKYNQIDFHRSHF